MTWWFWLGLAIADFLLGVFVGHLISTFGGSDESND